MDVTSLIELIRRHLRDGLTVGQAEEIRARLAGSPEACEALARKLEAEDALAEDGSAVVANFGELMTLIDALPRERRARRPILPACLAVGVLALIGAIIVVWLWPGPAPPGDGEPTTCPGRGHVAVGATRPMTGSATRWAGRHAATQPTGTGATGPATVTTRQAGSAPALTPGPMTWEQYVLPDRRDRSGWPGQAVGLFLDSDGKDVASQKRRDLQLEGTYRLGVLPAKGRMIRLGVRDARQCEVTFWIGDQGARVLIDGRSWAISGQALTRSGDAGETVTATSDDRGTWRWYDRGTIDLRYQDAHLLVCRGEVCMLHIPLAAPPATGEVKASGVRLVLARAVLCRPLPPYARRATQTPFSRTSAGKLKWTRQGTEKMTLLIDADSGVVSLAAANDRDEGRAWCEIEFPPLTGIEVTVRVRHAKAPTSVLARIGDSSYEMRLNSHQGKRVVGPNDRRTMEQDVRDGRTVGQQFWVRYRCGIDTIMAWVSPNGTTWWPRRIQTLYTRTGPFQLGLYVHRDKAAHGIAIDQVAVRRFDAIRRMIRPDAELLAKADAAMTREVLTPNSLGKALAALDNARPKDVGQDPWRKACDVALVSHSRHASVRQDAMRELLLAACRNPGDGDVAGVLAAIEELIDLPSSTETCELLDDVFCTLGQFCLDTGRTKALRAVLDASYIRPGSAPLPAPRYPGGASQGLLRMALLDLMARGEWASVRHEATRAIFMASGRDRHGWPELAAWAATEAAMRLDGETGTGAQDVAAAWRHPLVVGNHSAVMNVLGEFMFLMKGKQYAEACKVITSQTLPDTLVALDSEGEILQSSHYMIREMIRTTPQTQEVLGQEAYTNIGMIRLERARKQNDVETLRSLAAQFHGTAAGLGALHVLADRDLSTGNASAAADRYDVLRAAAHYAKRDDAAAKFRLAKALTGQLAGRPVMHSVALGDETFSPQEFERMVKQLASARKAERPAAAPTSASRAPGPGGARARLTHLTDVPGGDVKSRRQGTRPTAFAMDGNRLIVSHSDRLFAVDCLSKKVLWLHVPPPSPRNASRWRDKPGEDTARILRIGDMLCVRTGLEGRPLACYDAATGEKIWTRRYDHRVLSDPIAVGSFIYVVSARHDMSDALFLHRVYPHSGQLALSHRLVAVRDEWPAVGRPVVVGNAMIFRAAGCLISCDLRGTIRWARRLSFVPASALPELHTDVALDDIIVFQDKKVVFTAPGCPEITCVAADSGKVLWTRLIHSPTGLVGPVGSNVIVIAADRIRGLDCATGEVRWTHHLQAGGEVRALPAAEDTVALVRLEKGQNKRYPSSGRYVRWISARDGRTVRQLPIEGDSTLHDVLTLFGDTRRIFGLSNFVHYKPGQGKIFMIEIDPESD